MKIKLLYKEAKMPTKASKHSAGFDLYVPAETLIVRGRNLIKLGFALQLEPGYEAHIRPRSGFSLHGIEGFGEKRHNADVIQGTIDADYRGQVGVIIKSNVDFILPQGTRIAQMVIEKCYTGELELVKELDNNDRGGGFGHSGAK